MRAILTIALLFVPSAALAHSGHAEATGLAAGLAHPLGGLDHILAMVAVGVLAAAMGGRALLLVPASFVLMMVGGFALALAGIGLPYMELGITASALVIGASALFARRLSVLFATAVVGAFAVFHGAAHGLEMAGGNDWLLFAAGFVAATALLHALGIGAGAAAVRLGGRLLRTQG